MPTATCYSDAPLYTLTLREILSRMTVHVHRWSHVYIIFSMFTCYKSHSVILRENQPITCSTDRDLKELVDTFGLQATVITRISNAQYIICGNKYIVE